MSQIISLEIENVKKISAVHIKPDGPTVVIGGMNGAGKTSVLDSIAYALGGKALLPAKPLRQGAKRGKVRVELEDITIERTFTPTNSYLKVTSAIRSSPQAILDDLIGRLTFDPLRFATMDTVSRVALLKDLVGLDFTILNTERERVYAERHTKNLEIKKLRALVDTETLHDVPDTPISIAELMGELRRRQEVNARHAQDRARLQELRAQTTPLISRKKALIEQIKALQEELVKINLEIDTLTFEGKTLSKHVDTLQDLDVQEISQQIADADELNAKIRANITRKENARLLWAASNKSAEMTARISKIDIEKRQLSANTRYPIDGLSITDDGVVYNGIPFDQISQAEKLRLSVAIGFALNPKLKVMLIRDGSLLDDDNLQLIGRLAEEHGGQVWIERVGNGSEISVLIEDGAVKV